MEESRVLIWHRDKLKLSIINEPFLQTVFDHILGRDVVKKLMQVTQVSWKYITIFRFIHWNWKVCLWNVGPTRNQINSRFSHYSAIHRANEVLNPFYWFFTSVATVNNTDNKTKKITALGHFATK